MKLLIADDHSFLRAGLEAILRDTDFDIVASVENGQQALDSIPAARPDILLLDVAMPIRSGMDVARILRSRGDRRPIVLLTAALDDRLLVEAIELGIEGIMLKEGAQEMLIECLNAVRRGGRWIEPMLLQRGLHLASRTEGADDRLAEISPKERAIVGLVAQGLRNREIATELGMTEGTVKVYLHRIYEKLGISNRTELAIYATGQARA